MTTSAGIAAAIRIEGVNLSYGRNHVLKDINLEINPGEFFAFLGPSGCGKTTLLRLIAGFNQADTGRVLIGGEDISALPPWRRNVGMVFQSYALWPHMTVRRNVAFGLEERRVPRAEIERRVEAALALVGLGALAERRPSQLSGGQQQRVALARTIVIEPKVLLLDEPLSNLDAKLRLDVRRELGELQRRLGITTIFVTHDQEEANTICDRIAVMSDGVVQQVGTPLALYSEPANLFVAGFLGTANVVSGRPVQGPGGPAFEIAGGGLLPLPPAAAAVEGIRLVFRPQQARLQLGEAAPPLLPGIVSRREFLGATFRYGVQIGEAEILVDVAFGGSEAPIQVGTTVGVEVDLRAARWLAR